MVYNDSTHAPRGEYMWKNKNKNTARWQVPVLSPEKTTRGSLVKIGDIARAYGILPSTINFYTREGLLPEDARSQGGYRLYSKEKTIQKLKRIEYLQQEKRLSIEEIKKTI